MSGRMSQSSFMRHMKDLQFPGDAKLIWVCHSAVLLTRVRWKFKMVSRHTAS